jgi:propane monooxygenase reductase subunit
VYEDLVIELLNYDEEMIRSGLPLVSAVAEVVANEPVTRDMRRLVIRLVEPAELRYFPGQYLDFAIPGSAETRSFSMANPPGRDGLMEFVVKIYPGGLFSQYLAERVAVGDRLDVEGPFGAFTLRENRTGDLVFVAGGAGLAPVLALLRTMADRGIDRKCTFYYGVRTRQDLCFEDELRDLEERLPGFRYVPALSEPGEDGWAGETGLITDVVARLEPDLSGRNAYVCGPPPMVEAAVVLLERLGLSAADIFYDKFTTTGESEGE